MERSTLEGVVVNNWAGSGGQPSPSLEDMWTVQRLLRALRGPQSLFDDSVEDLCPQVSSPVCGTEPDETLCAVPRMDSQVPNIMDMLLANSPADPTSTNFRGCYGSDIYFDTCLRLQGDCFSPNEGELRRRLQAKGSCPDLAEPHVSRCTVLEDVLAAAAPFEPGDGTELCSPAPRFGVRAYCRGVKKE